MPTLLPILLPIEPFKNDAHKMNIGRAVFAHRLNYFNPTHHLCLSALLYRLVDG